MSAVEIVKLIHDLDKGSAGGLTLTRWNDEGSGEEDETASALVRSLARGALTVIGVEGVGADIVRAIDAAAQAASREAGGGA